MISGERRANNANRAITNGLIALHIPVPLSGIWDGTFKPAYSNNPAWCLWDMLTHPRYGMGQRIGAADVDRWALYAIGRYCDQMVPDGFGGTEPRMTFNAYLQNCTIQLSVHTDTSLLWTQTVMRRPRLKILHLTT